VLWIGDRISALLDWEMCGLDPFAYDLGVALNAWCFAAPLAPGPAKGEEAYSPGTFHADRAKALLAGYKARRKIEPETLAGLYEWTRFAALRFTVARLKGYPPPGARAPVPAGKDWREFRDRLATLRGMAEASFRAMIGM
jgi:homoserine kinase type II